jgi:hypothetical protein
MKQISLALLNYEKAHGSLPPACTTDADGKPMHSWRTLILPYLGQMPLYKSIDLTKPWNDPVNAAAFNTRLDTYQCPSVSIPNNHTNYLAIVTPNSAIRLNQSVRLAEISDGTAQTLFVVEVGTEHSVPWMSPQDADEQIVLALGDPDSKLHHDRVFTAAFADGHAEATRQDVDAGARRAMISAAGNDVVVEGGEN